MPSKFTIRPTSIDDELKINELLSRSYPVLMARSYSASVLAAALPAMTKSNPALLILKTFHLAETADGQVIGCGGWSLDRPGRSDVEPQLAHIRHFATDPEWLRQGVGRAIYLRCEAETRLAGVRQLECLASLNSEGFYRSLGFTITERIEIPMGSSVPCPVNRMNKMLPI